MAKSIGEFNTNYTKKVGERILLSNRGLGMRMRKLNSLEGGTQKDL